MFRQLLSSILILATISQVLPYAYYSLIFAANERAIASSLCEKKVPHCNGHCFLKKQIANDAKQNDDRQTVKQKFETVQFFEEQSDFLPHLNETLTRAVVPRLEIRPATFAEVSTPPPRI